MTHSFPTLRSSDLSPVPGAWRPKPWCTTSHPRASRYGSLTVLLTVGRVDRCLIGPTCQQGLTPVRVTSADPSGPDRHEARHREDGYHNEDRRSEEHTSALQSLMRTSSAVFC